jgi:hypothetical protein
VARTCDNAVNNSTGEKPGRLWVAKAARQEARSSEARRIKRAIRELRDVSDTLSGSTLAKEARALERALAAPNSRKATTQRRVKAFAQAAAKYSPPVRVSRVAKKRTKDASKAQTATPGIVNREERNKRDRYEKGVFKCGSDYHKCCQQHSDWKLCAALLALCITNELKWLGAAAYGVKYMISHL